MTQADNDDTSLQTNTVNNHLKTTSENAVNMGQSCDTYVLENSQLNTSVNTLNNRTETLNEEVEDPLNEYRSPAKLRATTTRVSHQHKARVNANMRLV